MKPPIIIVEEDDLSVCESIEYVEHYHEPGFIYISHFNNEKVKVYDSEGYVLDISEGINEVRYKFLFFSWKRRYKGVKLTQKIPKETREDELRDALIKILIQTKRGKNENIQKKTLTELIQLAEEFGFSY